MRAPLGADPHLDQPAGLEHPHRLAHRAARGTEQSAQLALGRQPVAGFEVLGLDQAQDLLDGASRSSRPAARIWCAT